MRKVPGGLAIIVVLSWTLGCSSSGGASSTPGSGGIATGGTATGGTATGGLATGGLATGGIATGGVTTGGIDGAPTGGTSGSAGGVGGGGTATGGGGTGGTGGAAVSVGPPMGWNNFNHFVDAFTHKTFEQQADAMVSSGLRDVGYRYINIDDTWDLHNRDAAGNLVPDAAKFPNGIKGLADYVHARGLKLGIYADRGVLTCSHFPGSFGHEKQDAALFASWGVDFIKVDNCFPNVATIPSKDRTDGLGGFDWTEPPARYQQAIQVDYMNWKAAIDAAGRPVVFSICAWWSYPWEPQLGTTFRTTRDIKASWTSFLSTLDANGGDTSRYRDAFYPPPGIAHLAGPGHYNDPDMLEVGNAVKGGGMTAAEDRAQFSLWAVMAAPLILGNDLTQMSTDTLATLSNPEVIAIDQDPAGVQGVPIGTGASLEVWAKRLAAPKAFAVVLFNRTGAAAPISVAWSSLGLTGPALVRDLWTRKDLGSMPSAFTATVPSHAVVMIRVIGS